MICFRVDGRGGVWIVEAEQALLRRHFDGLIIRLNLKREVQRDGSANADRRGFRFRCSEALGLDGDLIGAWVDLGKEKMAAGVRCAGAGRFRVHVRRGDRCVGHSCSARVRHLAGEGAAGPALRLKQSTG